MLHEAHYYVNSNRKDYDENKKLEAQAQDFLKWNYLLITIH